SKISGLVAIRQAQQVFEQLKKSGLSFAEFKQAVKDGVLDVDLTKVQRDAAIRNNVQVAYNRGRWTQQQQDSRITHLMYLTREDSQVRPNHAAINRIVLPKDHPFWMTHYAPNGFNCRCIVIGLTAEEAKRIGITDDKDIPTDSPDVGWDFNAGDTYATGIHRALDQAAAKLKSLLGDALDLFIDKIKGL
ncbi:MAG: phage minor head protein, partial [Pseudomonadota bacterium]|nr:phage minor head protein [Pseudomonadota bacterium]